MLAIKNNLMAENAARHLASSYDALAKSVERLSSGLRINSAKDDAAGLAVRELIRADVAALRQGARNALDAISLLQTAEGGLSMMDDLLIRMRELAEQAATGSYSTTQVDIMEEEFAELAEEMTRISESTDFNEISLLDDTQTDAVEIALGQGLVIGQTIKVDKQNMSAIELGVGGKKGVYSGLAVGVATDNYMTDETTSATSEIEFNMVINGTDHEMTINVSGGKTLAEVVELLNAESRGEVAGWNVAQAHESTETGQFVLKLTGWEAGPITSFTINADADGDANDVTWGNDTVLCTVAIANTHFESVAGCTTLTLGDQDSINAVVDAINTKDGFRAHLGYMMNRLEAAGSVIAIQAENLLAAESRISDVDVATEMAAMTRAQVLSQTGIAMLAQANAMPQMALSLVA